MDGIRAHHRRASERAVARLDGEPGVLAVIVGGSVSRGHARPDSDLDVMIVVSADDFARRRASLDTWFHLDLSDVYDGGYVDGKYVGENFVRAVAERGSEPARWAFSGAEVVFSRVPDLADVVARCPVYPEAERAEKLREFAAQLMLLDWFCGEAARHADNPYLEAFGASRTVLFAGRLLLAHNRMLYPYHKWLLRELERAPDKPAGTIELMRRAAGDPAAARELANAVLDHTATRLEIGEAVGRFTRNNEWAWLDGAAPLEDR